MSRGNLSFCTFGFTTESELAFTMQGFSALSSGEGYIIFIDSFPQARYSILLSFIASL